MNRLKRTTQCAKCPWRKDVNPHDIPNGYDPKKHEGLANTIAEPADLSCLNGRRPLHVMACHEGHDAYCVGWLHHQLGVGNNIALRIRMMSFKNLHKLTVVGEQHERFEDTLPKEKP